MPRDLFGDVTRPSISIGNRKWYTVPLSLFTHSLAVALVIALPLLAPAVMPSVFAEGPTWTVPFNPPPPPPPPAPRLAERLPQPVTDTAVLVDAPNGITPEKPQPQGGFEDAQPGPGIVRGDPGVVLAPPPSPPPSKPPDPVRPGGQIRPPQRTHDVRPVYPPLALAARVQGTVIIEATIGVDGRVINARVLRSVQLLDQAALDAVRQWEYVPTTLNGVPVPVIMSVTVTFTLQ
jgi:protein TonB